MSEETRPGEVERTAQFCETIAKTLVRFRSWDLVDDHLLDCAQTLRALEAENTRLREALKPFAEAADELDEPTEDGCEIWEHPCAMSITCGDLRRARAALGDDA